MGEPVIRLLFFDLSLAALTGRLDPVIGREAELERTMQILARRSKNNPILIGPAGVGKTAIAEGLALRIIEGRVPEHLLRCRVVALDTGLLTVGTRFRGDFQEYYCHPDLECRDRTTPAGPGLLHTCLSGQAGAAGKCARRSAFAHPACRQSTFQARTAQPLR